MGLFGAESFAFDSWERGTSEQESKAKQQEPLLARRVKELKIETE
jgi:hypothetical protein